MAISLDDFGAGRQWLRECLAVDGRHRSLPFQSGFDPEVLGEVIGSRSGVVLTRRQGDRLVAAKIDGHYWRYYTHPCALAWSDNLIDWMPVGKSVWSGNHEAGAIALLRDEGILLMFNSTSWPSRGVWTLGQALIDRSDLLTVLRHQDQPFLYPELDWEMKGFTDRTTVANTLVPFKGQWLLYYGAADRVIGLAAWGN